MTDEFDPQANALDAYLQHEGDHLTPGENHPIFFRKVPFPQEEARLAGEIRRLAHSVQPEPGFDQELERRLMQLAAQRKPPRERRGRLGCWLAASGLSVALLIGLVWIARAVLLLDAAPAATQPVNTPAASQTATPLAAAGQPTRDTPATSLPVPTAAGSAAIDALVIQPELDFLLETEFPEAPSAAGVYRQAAREALTPANAEARAAQLGVSGDVYLTPSSPPSAAGYMVWDGVQKVTFYGSPNSFRYESGNPALFPAPDCAAPCLAPGTEDALINFLNERGLLGFPAETRPSIWRAQVDQLVQTIEDRPLLYRSGEYQGEARIDALGQVQQLDYNPVSLENLGSFPVLSAAQAWEAAAQVDTTRGITLLRRTAPAEDAKTWRRVYPPGEPVEIFGSVEVYQSATNGSTLDLLQKS